MHRDVNEGHLSYYINELSPRLKVGGAEECIDIKSLFTEDAFRLVIIASSCTHQSMVLAEGGTRGSRVQSIEAQQNAILALRQATSTDLSQVALKQIFQASALLCVINGMLDPCDGGVSFRSHLEATKAILDRIYLPSRPLHQEVQPWTFFLSIFSTMELVNAIMTGKRTLHDPNSWRAFGSCYCWWGILQADDQFLDALSLLAQMANIGADLHATDSQVEAGTLLTLHAAVQKLSIVAGSPDTAEWSIFCAIYRNAASLYLYRAIAQLQLNHTLVRETVSATLTLLERLPRHSRSCCLLPILMVGLNCIEVSDMDLVRTTLTQIHDHLFFGAIVAVSKCLEKHWHRIIQASVNGTVDDFNWWVNLPEIADSVCLF